MSSYTPGAIPVHGEGSAKLDSGSTFVSRDEAGLLSMPRAFLGEEAQVSSMPRSLNVEYSVSHQDRCSAAPNTSYRQVTPSRHDNMLAAENTNPRSLFDKPIVVPATSATLGSPFLRAYPPLLDRYQISRELFLNFIDDLNRVAVKNPPLQVLGLAGSVVTLVPLHTAQIVGHSINAVSQVGTIAASKGRTEITLRDANKAIFEPRGLKAEIGKLNVVATIAKIPDLLDVDGKIRKDSSILPALGNDLEDHTVSGQQRRIAFLEPWIAHLEVDPLPEIEKRANIVSQWSVKASEFERKRGEKKMLKERDKAYTKYSKESEKERLEFEEEMTKLDKEETKVRRKEREPEKIEKEMAKIQKERMKVVKEHDKEMYKVEQDRIKDDKENEFMRKILFLIVREMDTLTNDPVKVR